MTPAALTSAVPNAELAAAIESSPALGASRGAIARLRRWPWAYATSAPLEIITVSLHDGRCVELVLKHLAVRALSDAARRVKPAFVLDPRREIEVYRKLLSPLGVGPRLVGWGARPETDTYWLLTERVRGREMYQVGELATWQAVARWLAGLHGRFAEPGIESAGREARLLDYDRQWYAGWMERARRFFATEDPPNSRYGRTALLWLADRHPRVVERLLSLPPTIVHGEFYAPNVLVVPAGDGGEPGVCPVDWEMTARGPGVIDLAALMLGEWREDQRRDVIASYLDASALRAPATLVDMVDAVACAQIHLAVQWLGWFGRRRTVHARDWLADAVERAEALRL